MDEKLTLMKKKIMGKRFAACVFLMAALAAAAVSLYYFQHKRTISLGFFTGSAWDVPDAYTYQLIDDAVEKFEAGHPGVKVKLVSGIQKDDYSEYIASVMHPLNSEIFPAASTGFLSRVCQA